MAELNLIPYRIREQRRKRFLFKQYIYIAIIIFCLLFFGLYFPMGTLSGLENKSNSLKQQISVYQVTINENQSLSNQINTLNKYISEVNGLTINKISVFDRVRGIEAYIPLDIIFDSLVYDTNLITINGAASNYSSISEFAANLQMSKDYCNSKINNINYDSTNKLYKFTLTIRY